MSPVWTVGPYAKVFAVVQRTAAPSGLEDYGLSIKAYLISNHEWLLAAVLGAFTVMNALRILAYVPQILKAARDVNGASAISYATWTLFLISHLSTIAYALVGSGDLLMALVFAGNASACVAIIFITWVKRRRFRSRLAEGSGLVDCGVRYFSALRPPLRAAVTPLSDTGGSSLRRPRCRNAPYIHGKRRLPLLPLGRAAMPCNVQETVRVRGACR